MKAYKVIAGVVQVGEGTRIGLGHSQAEPRLHRLKPVDGATGVYIAAGVLQFRVGEIIGLESPADLGKAQVGQVAEATPDEIHAMVEDAKKVEARNRAAKAGAKDKGKGHADPKGLAAAAREEGRKAGYAAGLKAGEQQGDEAGYNRGFEDGKAAAQEAAWVAAYEGSAELKAQFPTVDAYIADRRSAA